MVLKGVNWVHNDKMMSNGLERSQFGHTIIKLVQMVLKGVNRVHNDISGDKGVNTINDKKKVKGS